MGKSSKIGKYILAVILTTVLVLMVTQIYSAYRSLSTFGDSILQEEARSFVSILKSDYSELDVEAEYLFETVGKDEALASSLQSGDGEGLKRLYETYSSDESSFAAFCGEDGKIIWNSDNFPQSALIAETSDGLNSDGERMYYCYAKDISGAGSYIIGYDLCAYEYLDPIREKTGGQFTVFRDNIRYATTILNDDGTRFTGTEMADDIAEKVLVNGETYIGSAEISGRNYVVCYEPLTDHSGEIVGAYFGGYDTETVNEILNSKIGVMITVGAVMAVIITLISAVICYKLIKKKILVPVVHIGEMTAEMNKGNLGYKISDVKHSKDEVGELLVSAENMKDTLSGYIQDLSRVLGAMAEGDFTVHPSADYSGDFIELSRSAELIGSQMREIISGINRTSDNVYADASESAKGSDMLAAGTTRQAAAIEELSASLNEISDKVNETAYNAGNAMELADSASAVLEEQHKYMDQMIGAMNNISRQSNEIERIIKTIDDIAFQTNILALNAAVEAARAGDAGKGFAVVADEVRNLAEKSAEAVKSTSQLITAAVMAVSEGSGIAEKNAESLDSVVEIFDRTKNMINEISAAANTQSASIRQITSGINEISEVVQQTSATAQEIAASCQELNTQSIQLRKEVKHFIV